MEVTIYTMPTCKMSSWIKTVLMNKGIAFRERNFLNHKLKNKLAADLKAPLIELDSQIMIGFNADALRRMEIPIMKKLEEY